MRFRKIIFWLHLLAGLIAGIVVAVMSFTGVAIAFEEEILAWIDRDVRHVTVPDGAAVRLPLDQVLERAAGQSPERHATGLTVFKDEEEAWLLRFGRAGAVYVDPFTGTTREMQSDAAHDFLHVMVDWHRWLGMSGEGRAVGRAITGACNLAFLFLVVSGFYLWFPRRWSWKALRPLLWFVGKSRGRARDWNWHNVIGFWNAPVLIVLVATAVVISYPWASNLVYRLAGEEPPPPRRGPPGGAPVVAITPPTPDAEALLWEDQFRLVSEAFPNWQEVTLRLPNRGGDSADVSATSFSVKEVDQRPRFSSTSVSVDPYRGEILSASGFTELSTGRKARSWMRFLHTGEAFGIWGKVVAAVASFASLFLVWTGFALSWRRFFGKRGGRKARSGEGT